jgi:tRNA (adenine-N(1)-)-methyltransferase non-catalytic subunit
MVQKLAENNQSFEKKTEYSKAKYIKRKKSKYVSTRFFIFDCPFSLDMVLYFLIPASWFHRFAQTFTVTRPSVRTLCQLYFSKNPQKIRGMRLDTIGLMMCLANVHPGCRLIVTDDIGGLLVAALFERMGGNRANPICYVYLY